MTLGHLSIVILHYQFMDFLFSNCNLIIDFVIFHLPEIKIIFSNCVYLFPNDLFILFLFCILKCFIYNVCFVILSNIKYDKRKETNCTFSRPRKLKY